MHMFTIVKRRVITFTLVAPLTFVALSFGLDSTGVAQAVEVETVLVNTASGPKKVDIIRGIQPEPEPLETSAGPVDQPPYQRVVGMNGWFLDTENNRIGNCFKQHTAMVGGYRIRCVWKHLP